MTFPSFRFKMEGLDDAIRRVQYLDDLIKKHFNIALKEFGNLVVTYAKENHPYKDQTGYLTSTIGYKVEVDGTGLGSLSIFATAYYADAVEYGTPKSRPYPFLWPAYYSYLPRLEPMLQAAVDAAIEEAIDRTNGP